AYLVWGSYAYGAGEEGRAERGVFEERLRSIQAVVQNQDNREHDLLDSDDYYQFEGGSAAAGRRSITMITPCRKSRSSARWRKRSPAWCAAASSIRSGSMA